MCSMPSKAYGCATGVPVANAERLAAFLAAATQTSGHQRRDQAGSSLRGLWLGRMGSRPRLGSRQRPESRGHRHPDCQWSSVGVDPGRDGQVRGCLCQLPPAPNEAAASLKADGSATVAVAGVVRGIRGGMLRVTVPSGSPCDRGGYGEEVGGHRVVELPSDRNRPITGVADVGRGTQEEVRRRSELLLLSLAREEEHSA